MEKCRIVIGRACRSDEALTKPLIEAFSKQDWVECWSLELKAADFISSYETTESFLKTHEVDLVIAVGDRIEIAGSVQAAFLNNVKICHYGDGITNSVSTYDDKLRHQITLVADICLCESLEACNNVINLRYAVKFVKPHKIFEKVDYYDYDIHYVGNLYLEGLETIDESLVPKEPYDLMLLNPETLRKNNFEKYSQKRTLVQIGSNPDDKIINEIEDNYNDYYFYPNVPRPQFLGLMKHCERFITNSSAAYYEAPAFLKPEQIVMVGERNKGRSTPTTWNQDYKSSDRIIEIIKEWWSRNE